MNNRWIKVVVWVTLLAMLLSTLVMSLGLLMQ